MVHGTADAAVRESSVPATDTSAALRSYPDDLLRSPLDVREGPLRRARRGGQPIGGGTGGRAHQPRDRPACSAPLDSAARHRPGRAGDHLALLAALFYQGALRPWSRPRQDGGSRVPGGVARDAARHALFLGLTVTATHTAGVYLLGFVTLGASTSSCRDELYPILSLASGLLVVGMGVTLLAGRLRALAGGSSAGPAEIRAPPTARP
ncbi:MAG: hypothetical protein U0531_11225 [Dehalococcoidia bacterium]